MSSVKMYHYNRIDLLKPHTISKNLKLEVLKILKRLEFTINILLPSASSLMYGLTRLSGCRNLGDRTLFASSLSSVALKRVLQCNLHRIVYINSQFMNNSKLQLIVLFVN